MCFHKRVFTRATFAQYLWMLKEDSRGGYRICRGSDPGAKMMTRSTHIHINYIMSSAVTYYPWLALRVGVTMTSFPSHLRMSCIGTAS